MLTVTVFFITLVMLAIFWIVMLFRGSRYTFAQSILCSMNLLATSFFWRTTRNRPLPVPSDAGAVLFTNHRSSIDPFFVQQRAGRITHWMVADDFGPSGLVKWTLRNMEVINVSRSGQDTTATRKAIRCVQEGGVLGVFPEGRINMSDEFMMPLRPGAVSIALKGRVPIIPVYIEGSRYGGFALSPFLMPSRVRVHYGKPIDLSPWYDRESREALAEITVMCANAVAQLAGRDDFTPKLAGRSWKPSTKEVDELNAQARARMQRA